MKPNSARSKPCHERWGVPTGGPDYRGNMQATDSRVMETFFFFFAVQSRGVDPSSGVGCNRSIHRHLTQRLLGPLTFHAGRGADLLPTSAAARHASSLPGRLFSIYQAPRDASLNPLQSVSTWSSKDYNGFAWLALTIIAQSR